MVILFDLTPVILRIFIIHVIVSSFILVCILTIYSHGLLVTNMNMPLWQIRWIACPMGTHLPYSFFTQLRLILGYPASLATNYWWLSDPVMIIIIRKIFGNVSLIDKRRKVREETQSLLFCFWSLSCKDMLLGATVVIL